MTTFFFSIRKYAQILKPRVSRILIKSRCRCFNQVSVSVPKVTVSTTSLNHMQFWRYQVFWPMVLLTKTNISLC